MRFLHHWGHFGRDLQCVSQRSERKLSKRQESLLFMKSRDLGSRYLLSDIVDIHFESLSRGCPMYCSGRAFDLDYDLSLCSIGLAVIWGPYPLLVCVSNFV